MPRGKTDGGGRDQPLPPQQPAGQKKPPPRGESVTAYTQPAPDPYSQRIGVAQRNSANLVPVRTIVDLANLNVDQRDIAITARRMARTWDVSPQVFFGEQDPRKVVSRLTGQPVTMKDAQRFSDYYSPVAIAGMLAGQLPSATVTRAKGEPKGGRPGVVPERPVTAVAVGTWANVLARQFDLPLAEGITLAVFLAGRNINAKNFENNLPVIRTWIAGNGGDPNDVSNVVRWAANSSKRKVSSVDELQTALFGAGTVAVSQRVAQAETMAMTYGTPEQRTAAQAEALAYAQQVAAAGGGPIPGAINEKGMLGPDYYQQVLDAQESVRLSQTAFQNSLVGKVVAGGLAAMNYVYTKGEQWAWDKALEVATPIRGALLAVPGGAPAESYPKLMQDLQTARVQSEVAFHQGANIGELTRQGWSDILGVELPDWTGQAFDFALWWEFDPTIIAGKIGKLSRAERLLPELESRSLIRTALGNIGISQAERRLGAEALATRADEVLAQFSARSGVSTYTLRGLPKDVLERSIGSFLNRGPETLKLSGVFGAIAKRNDTLMRLATQRFTSYVTDELPASRLSRSLFERAADPAAFAHRLDTVSIGTIANRTLDPTYMDLLRTEVLKRFPDLGPDAWQAWQDGMKAHFVGWGPENSAAEAAVAGRLGVARADIKAMADNLPEVYPKDFTLGSAVNLSPETGLWHPPFTAEAPGSGWVSEFGPRRRVRSAITNERFTESAFGKRMAALPNMNPGRQMPLWGTGAADHILLDSRRYAVFSETEVRGFQQEAQKLLGAGGGTERNLMGLRGRIDDEALHRILAPFHFAPEAELQLRAAILDPYRSSTYRAKAFGPEYGPEGPRDIVGVRPTPGIESQLSNFAYVIDPVQVRAAVREYTGVIRRMRAHLYNSLGKEAPEIAARLDNIAHRTAVSLMTGTGEALNDFRHIWKALVIARPGYVPRVVLGDENLRYLSVTLSLMERTLGAEWYGAVSKLERLGGERLGVSGQMERRGLFTQEFRSPDGEILGHVGLPGAYEMNPLATGNVRESELLNDVLRRTKIHDTAHLGGVSWNLLDATDNVAGQMTGWVWALNKQLPNSTPGRVALESVARGEDLAKTRQELLAWAERDHYTILRQDIGVGVEQTDDWANWLSTLTHAYTYDRPQIAAAALTADAKDLRSVLESAHIPLDQRPIVHGPTIDANLKGIEGVAGFKPLNKMYDVFVRWPEAHMNRQPFFKVMKRRAERGYYGLLADSGEKITPGILRAIDNASTEFALDQVSRVMFDFTKQSRFTELLQFLFPFPQPFFEGFQAWGHLIHRDPGVIGRAHALYSAGVNTGWIVNDPVSGEQVVDLKPLRWGAVQAAGLFGMDQARANAAFMDLVAPLTNFNMLATTTLRLPTDTGGVFGKIAGGAPIPMMSLRPEVQAFAQWAFTSGPLKKWGNNETVASYLFQYGPGTSFIPRPLQAVAQLIDPGVNAEDNQHKALADSLLRAYQVNHISWPVTGPDGKQVMVGFDANGDTLAVLDAKGNNIGEDLLLQAVKTDANHAFTIRSLLGLVSPAAPSIRTQATPYETMWQDYLDQAKQDDPENYFQVASDRWQQDHPDLWLIPIGKTLQTSGITDPRTGKTVSLPRVPASKLVADILANPDIANELIKTDKGWAGLLLIGLDPTVADSQDWPVYSKLVADGTFRYRTPEEFFGKGTEGRAWRDINDFYTNTWNPGMAGMEAAGLDTNDTRYLALQQSRRSFLTGLYQKFPGWVRSHLHYNEGGGYWDWPESTPNIPVELTIAQARSIVAAPGFGSFPGVKAMGKFLDLYDETKTAMKKQGYTSITQDTAELSGFTHRFAVKVRKIIDETPGIEPYLSAAFGLHLSEPQGGAPPSRFGQTGPEGITVASSDILIDFPSAKYTWYTKLKPDLQEAAVNYDTKIEVLKDAAFKDYDTSWERSDRYLELQKYMDTHWTQHPGLVKAWWNTGYSPAEKEQYRQGLAVKPAIFYSAFDWHLMGVNISKTSVKAFQDLASARRDIDKFEYDDPTGFSVSAGYEQLNTQVKAYMGKNKNFAHAIDIANDWSFPLKASGLADMPGKAGWIWGQLVDITRRLKNATVDAGIQGLKGSGNTDQQTIWYSDQQKALKTWVERYTKPSSDGYDSAFAASWQELTGAISDPIIGTIILPDTYYGPWGVPGYGK